MVSVSNSGDFAIGYAIAQAPHATISVKVCFLAHPSATKGELQEQAKDEALKYLDPA